jgi:hypothetical protein
MFAHLGPAPPVHGTDLIVRAAGARAWRPRAVTAPGAPVAGRPGKQATAEGGPWR